MKLVKTEKEMIFGLPRSCFLEMHFNRRPLVNDMYGLIAAQCLLAHLQWRLRTPWQRFTINSEYFNVWLLILLCYDLKWWLTSRCYTNQHVTIQNQNWWELKGVLMTCDWLLSSTATQSQKAVERWEWPQCTISSHLALSLRAKSRFDLHNHEKPTQRR